MTKKILLLAIIAFGVLITDIVLCLCISLIIPKYMIDPENYVYDYQNKDLIIEKCHCYILKLGDVDYDLWLEKHKKHKKKS